MKKRLLPLLLALILCLGLFPLSAMAGTEEPTKENPAPLSSATIDIPSSFGDTWIYQGSAVEPNVYVSVNGTYMFEGDDFSVSYENNNGPGTGTIIISALPGGRLTGQLTKYFTIEQLDGDLSSSKTGVYLFGGNSDGTFPWTGSQVKPDVMVELNDMWTLTGSEYSVEYGPNKDPGQAWVKITGNGTSTGGVPVTGTRTVYFKIVKEGACPHTNTTPYYDDTKHWYECDECHEHLNEEPHVQRSNYNDTHHWWECAVCDWESDREAHTKKTEYNQECHWETCSGCNWSSDNQAHSFTTAYDDTNHWGHCDCGYDSEKESHAAFYRHNETQHWGECQCGWQSEPENHAPVDQPAVNGMIVSECECGYSTTRPVPDLSQVETTGDPNKSYTQQDIAAVGLKGLQEGKDYTSQTVASQDEDGNDIWIKTFKPIEGRSVGEKVFKGKRGEEIHMVPTFKLTIHYVAENPDDQKRMPQDANAKVYQNDYYRYQSPSVHSLYPDVRVVEGRMPNSDLTVTVTYSRSQTAMAKDTYMLTINYVAADPKNNDKMPPTYHEVVQVGKTYSRFSPAVAGLKENIKVVDGVMPAHDVEVTVTYAKKYTLTIKMVLPGGDPEATTQDGGIWMEKFELDDGTAYSFSAGDLFTTEALMSDVNLEDTLTGEGMKGSWFTADILGISFITGMLQESGAVFTPDRDPIQGKIEGADKLEIVKFSCPHPDQYQTYSSNEDGTHDFKCDLCGQILLENEACDYDVKEYTVGDLPKDLQAKYPNGATYYQCPLCKHEYWVNPDDEPCPESPEGLPHIWTLWYPADENHCHRTCARCGLDVTEPHAWGEWTSRGGLSHYRKCAHCKETQEGNHGNWTNINVTSPATCIENAKVTATCGVCNARITNVSASLLGKEYLATGHDFENGPWHIDGPHTVSAEGAGGHYKSCAVCGVTDREHMTGHTWGGKTVISAGVCDDPSQKHVEEATCTACGAKLHSETEVHHDQVRYPEGDIAATCEDYGKEAYKCSVCNTVFGDAIPPLGHDMQVVEKKDADCEHEGYIKRKCSRCNLEETEVLEKKSKSGKHQWVPNVSVPDCLLPGEAKGETCSVCGATQAGNTGFETFPALGHKVKKETRTVGRTREYVSDNGVTTCTCYEVYYICERCGHALGHEYYTVGTNPNISRYQIEPGKNVRIDDVSGGIHIDGNMANDGGVYFNEEVKKGVNDLLDWAGEKYVWKKTPANSYIIEFTEEFMNELEDGEYPLEVTNGDEYWPMIVVVKDHKFVEIKNLPDEGADAPEWTLEQLEAWKADLIAQGNEVKELYQGCSEGRDN